jgi:DnaJ family protein C protein 27
MTKEQEMTESKTLKFKVISLGPIRSGKSCLIKRYCEERFVASYKNGGTIGVDYGLKEVKLKVSKDNNISTNKIHSVNARVNLFDMSGSPDYLQVRSELYSNVDGVFLVYDISDRQSFECLPGWIQEMKQHGLSPSGERNLPVCLFANKVDKSSNRAVSQKEGHDLAIAHKMSYYETSALSGEQVNVAFDFLFDKILSNQKGRSSEII